MVVEISDTLRLILGLDKDKKYEESELKLILQEKQLTGRYIINKSPDGILRLGEIFYS